MSIEHEVTRQFARVFGTVDSYLFKKVAEYYFQRAATLRMADIHSAADIALLIRNVQKRLFIGIGTELLLKALYLQKGFAINKPSNPHAFPFPTLLANVADCDLTDSETYTLNQLIMGLPTLGPQFVPFQNGLRIAKIYRNKEGHVVTSDHQFVSSHYREIEGALIGIYKVGFAEGLRVHFSLAPNERAVWTVEPQVVSEH